MESPDSVVSAFTLIPGVTLYFRYKATIRHLVLCPKYAALAAASALPGGFRREIHPRGAAVISPEIFGIGMSASVTQYQKFSLTPKNSKS